MSELDIAVSRLPEDSNARLIVLRGKIDQSGTPLLQEALENLRRGGMRDFVIDMEAVDFVASVGIAMLVTFTDENETAGGSVALVQVGTRVQAQFDTLGLNDFLKRYKSRDEATRSFRRKDRPPPVAPANGPQDYDKAEVRRGVRPSSSRPLTPLPAVPRNVTPGGTATDWVNPLTQRYAGRRMIELFGDRKRFTTWRDLWIALAEAEKELGLPITETQIGELKSARDRVDASRASEIERETRHDVMAHIRHYGEQAPGAAGIIHLGATSMFVVDNTDLIVMREALGLLIPKVARACRALADFAAKWKNTPCLGFTHFQPAQVTTVGRRACLWLQDLLIDLKELIARRDSLRFLGVKGAIGTQASFLALFEGDKEKVEDLDRRLTKKMGFKSAFRVTGQTYTRKVDAQVMAALSGIAQSAAKFSNDVRLAQSRGELQEPFGKGQVGSSAMAYKQNPAKSERIAGLARFVISLEANMPLTAAAQWFERTLDDSANKRLSVPEAFLGADAILNLVISVAEGLVVYPKVIDNYLRQELPFLATEDLLMAAVKAGGDRQQLHEKIREASVAAFAKVREEGKPNDLFERLAADPAFAVLKGKGAELLDAKRYVGRAPEQVDLFLLEEVEPALSGVELASGDDLEVRV
ncbi:MAG: adenylosuccinate lyase [Planctomycetota bacterium]